MKKKFTLLIAALLTSLGFSATAAVGDTFTASGYNFKVVAEGDVNEVEFAPKASGSYNVTSTTAFSSLATVTNEGITYTIVGVGEYAFQNAQFPSNGNTNMPANIRYISDYAFMGVKSGSTTSRGSIRFYGNALRYISSKAFLDNRLQGSILITSGDAVNGFSQVNSLVTSSYSSDANMYLAAEHGTKYIAFPWSYPAGTSAGWAPVYKVVIGAEIKTIGAYAMMNCTNYKQIDLTNVEVIDTAAFKNTVLTTITFPASITHVAADAFEGNTSLTRVTVNCSYDAVKDMVFDDAVYNRIRQSGSITVPAADLETFQNDPNWYKFWSETPPAPPVTRVYFAEAENGEVTADNLGPAGGATVTLTVTPAAGYKLESIRAEAFIDSENAQAPRRIEGPEVGLNVELTPVVEGQTYTFVMPEEPYKVLVTPEFAPARYTITVAETENGTVVADKTEAAEGETVTLTVTPAEGYELTSLTYTAEGAEPVAIENGSFTMPAANVTINATFAEIPPVLYTITVAETENGTVVADKAEAEEGETVTLTVTPAEGYQLDALTVMNGEVEVEVVDNAFTMPAGNVTVTATFAEIPPVTYPINVVAAENGTVVADPTAAAIGQTVTLTVTPAEGYQLKTITVNAGYEIQADNGDDGGRAPRKAGGTWYNQGSITLTKVDDTHYTFVLPEELPNFLTPNYVDNTEFRVNATFEEIPPVLYTITVAETENGTVTADKAEAAEGETVTLTVTPAEGYQLDALTVMNGEVEVEVVDNAFTMPAGNVTVTATFAEIPPVLYTITVAETENGTVTADKAEAEEGETVTLTVTPAEGYQLEALTVMNGEEEVEVVDNAFTMPAGNVTVTATFTEIPPVLYTVTYTAQLENGTVAVAVGDTEINSGDAVAAGETVSITITPAEGYQVESVTVETTSETETPAAGAPAHRAPVDVNGSGNRYTFVMPEESVTIDVSLVQTIITGVNDLRVNSDNGVKYVNPMGQVSDRPFQGVNIVVDGGKTYKVIKNYEL
ncbi:MAG: leucine-rich repeat protein [Muribaculaceae bacterium]|nr:leucine-rich repeat protein [Muribaculaceae bacterium]